MDGPTDEVVKAYERFIRRLEDQRLRAKNEKAALTATTRFERETFTDAFVGAISGTADPWTASDTLLRDGELEGEIDVGSAQDSDAREAAACCSRAGELGSRRKARRQDTSDASA